MVLSGKQDVEDQTSHLSPQSKNREEPRHGEKHIIFKEKQGSFHKPPMVLLL